MIQATPKVTMASVAAALPAFSRLRVASVAVIATTTRFTRINGTRPLPNYPSNDKATDADKVAVFNSLYLNSGTYTVTANLLATKAMVAKSAFAIGGPGNQYEFTVNGNSLVLTQKPSGPVIKLVRVE